MNQPTSSDITPRIQLSATLSPDTLSLSSSTPSAAPIYLNLRARLTDSSTPITILLSDSALSQTAQSFHRSYFDLTSQSRGHRPRQVKVHGILAPRVEIHDPQSQLLTLYPDGPAADMSIKVGVQVSPRYHERSDKGADTRPYLAVAATQLSGLEAGEGYEVGLKDINGEMPAYVWWWERGQKEDIVQRLEVWGFVVPVCSVGATGRDEYLRVEMEEKPVLKASRESFSRVFTLQTLSTLGEGIGHNVTAPHLPIIIEGLPTTLQEALIPNLPASGYYISNFITAEEEAHLLHRIASAPLPTWKHLSHRRLQAHPSPLSSSNVLLSATLPAWLSDPVIPRLLGLPVSFQLSQDNVFSHSPHLAPNHCLINEYLPGQGIHPHEDGDAYYPVVATVSLGSHIVLDTKRKSGHMNTEGWRILQEPRSLLITSGDLYTECLHGISEVEIDEDLGREGIVNWDLLGDKAPYIEGRAVRETRVSLTFRDVNKVQRLGKAFGGLFKR